MVIWLLGLLASFALAVDNKNYDHQTSDIINKVFSLAGCSLNISLLLYRNGCACEVMHEFRSTGHWELKMLLINFLHK